MSDEKNELQLGDDLEPAHPVMDSDGRVFYTFTHPEGHSFTIHSDQPPISASDLAIPGLRLEWVETHISTLNQYICEISLS